MRKPFSSTLSHEILGKFVRKILALFNSRRKLFKEAVLVCLKQICWSDRKRRKRKLEPGKTGKDK